MESLGGASSRVGVKTSRGCSNQLKILFLNRAEDAAGWKPDRHGVRGQAWGGIRLSKSGTFPCGGKEAARGSTFWKPTPTKRTKWERRGKKAEIKKGQNVGAYKKKTKKKGRDRGKGGEEKGLLQVDVRGIEGSKNKRNPHHPPPTHPKKSHRFR